MRRLVRAEDLVPDSYEFNEITCLKFMTVVDVVLVKIKVIVDIIITFTREEEEEEYVSLDELCSRPKDDPKNASRTILRCWRGGGGVLHAHREKNTLLKMVLF